MSNINTNKCTETRQKVIEKIIYDLAFELGYGDFSTLEPFEIDHKFWVDVGAEYIAHSLAARLANAKQTIHELQLQDN